MPRKADDYLAKLIEALAELDLWRTQEKAAHDQASKLSAETVKVMVDRGLKTITWAAMGKNRRATLIEPDKTIVDQENLLKAIPPSKRHLVTRTVLDMDLLSQAIDRGDINIKVLEKWVTTEPGTKSIRITGAGVAK